MDTRTVARQRRDAKRALRRTLPPAARGLVRAIDDMEILAARIRENRTPPDLTARDLDDITKRIAEITRDLAR